MAKKAILLTNLGSPDSYEVKDLKRYLGEFLMDERVIDIPYPLRALLVKGIIVPFRSPRSAVKYKSIWTENGSPLVHISRRLQEGLQQLMNIPVELCMRYGNPSVDSAFKKLAKENPELEEVVLVPLYPHYAMSSYETAVHHVRTSHQNESFAFELKVVPPFYATPDYLKALSESMRPFLDIQHDHILFSYHGVPERHIRKTGNGRSHCLAAADCCSVDSPAHEKCYRHQVIKTTRMVARELGLEEGKFSFSFQSRLGSDSWLRPYTAEQLAKFPGSGVRKLLIVCPAFVSDCLETLEEIQIEGRDIFISNGGEELTVIPCLNDRPDWINALAALIMEQQTIAVVF